MSLANVHGTLRTFWWRWKPNGYPLFTELFWRCAGPFIQFWNRSGHSQLWSSYSMKFGSACAEQLLGLNFSCLKYKSLPCQIDLLDIMSSFGSWLSTPTLEMNQWDHSRFSKHLKLRKFQLTTWNPFCREKEIWPKLVTYFDKQLVNSGEKKSGRSWLYIKVATDWWVKSTLKILFLKV